MAWEHEKSGTTILLDILRNVLILAATVYAVLWIWRWNWIIALIAAIPVYIVLLNVFGFLTLPLYAFTPENRLKTKVFKALEDGDFEKGKSLTDEFTEKFNVNVPTEPRTEKPENPHVGSTSLTEDEGVREKMLAYRRAVTKVIEIDNALLSTCRATFSEGYGPSGSLVCSYVDVIANASVENSRSRSELELPSSPQRIKQAIVEVATLAITAEEGSTRESLKLAYASLARFFHESRASVVTERNRGWFSENPSYLDLQNSERAEQIDNEVDAEEERLEQEFDEITLELLDTALARGRSEQTKAQKQLLDYFHELSPDDPDLVGTVLLEEYAKLDLVEGTSARYARDAIIAWKEGDRERALSLLTQAIDIDPDNGVALLNRGNLQLEIGAFESGIRDLERAHDIDPELPWENALVFKMLNAEAREKTRQAMLRKSEKRD